MSFPGISYFIYIYIYSRRETENMIVRASLGNTTTANKLHLVSDEHGEEVIAKLSRSSTAL
jgi:hypothetical protein